MKIPRHETDFQKETLWWKGKPMPSQPNLTEIGDGAELGNFLRAHLFMFWPNISVEFCSNSMIFNTFEQQRQCNGVFKNIKDIAI